MPLLRSLQVIFILFFTIPTWAQQRATLPPGAQPLQVEMPTPKRDAQAIAVLNQAIAAAGGMERLAAVRDYRAAGTVTRHEQAQDVQGLITISGSGVAQLKVEENLSTGNRSESMDSGRVTVKNEGASVKNVRGPAPFMPGSLVLPHRQLVTLLKDANLNVSYKGVVQIDGRSLYQIQAKLLYVQLEGKRQEGQEDGRLTKTFFVDAATFQVVMIQDTVPPSIPRKISYSGYRQIGGIPVPYSIEEEIGGTRTRTIRLDAISFNVGIQKSDFDLSRR